MGDNGRHLRLIPHKKTLAELNTSNFQVSYFYYLGTYVMYSLDDIHVSLRIPGLGVVHIMQLVGFVRRRET